MPAAAPLVVDIGATATPYATGHAHGSHPEAKAALAAFRGRWHKALFEEYAPASSTGACGADGCAEFCARFFGEFMRTTSYLADIEQHTPDLLAETRGLADGAGLPFEEVFSMSCIDELWSHGKAIAKAIKGSAAASKTTPPPVAAKKAPPPVSPKKTGPPVSPKKNKAAPPLSPKKTAAPPPVSPRKKGPAPPPVSPKKTGPAVTPRKKAPLPGTLGCSVVALHEHELAGSSVGGAACAAGQTMDLESYRDGAQLLLRLAGSAQRPGQVICTQAGIIGLSGANDVGIGLVVNNLWQLEHGCRGLPVAFVVRGILVSRTWEEACTFVQTVPHASGQAYTIMGPGGALATWECCIAGVAMLPYTPAPTPGDAAAAAAGELQCDTCVHCNHPLVPTLPFGERVLSLSADTLKAAELNSRARQTTLEMLLLRHREDDTKKRIEHLRKSWHHRLSTSSLASTTSSAAGDDETGHEQLQQRHLVLEDVVAQALLDGSNRGHPVQRPLVVGTAKPATFYTFVMAQGPEGLSLRYALPSATLTSPDYLDISFPVCQPKQVITYI